LQFLKGKKLPSEKSKIYITIQFLKDRKTIEYIDEYFESVCCTEDDILMTRTGNTGVVITKVSGVFHNNFFKINYNRKQIVREFLLHYLNFPIFQRLLLIKAGTSTIPDLNHGDFYTLPIILPPTLAEQTVIATALSDMDALISSIEKLITKKRLIKQGAMQQLLKPKDGWQCKSLKEIAIFRRGSFPQPYGLDKWYDDHNGTPFVQVYDVDDNFCLKNETKRKISKEGQIFSVFVKKGSIVLTIQGSIGRIAITNYDAYVDRTLLIFESFLLPFDTYFFALIIYLKFKDEKENAPGAVIKTITKEALSSFKISFPDLKEQCEISKVIQDTENEIVMLERKLDKFFLLKQGMMQNLLTGKIRLI
jgi:type I restriction enzyme, S subunit